MKATNKRYFTETDAGRLKIAANCGQLMENPWPVGVNLPKFCSRMPHASSCPVNGRAGGICSHDDPSCRPDTCRGAAIHPLVICIVASWRRSLHAPVSAGSLRICAVLKIFTAFVCLSEITVLTAIASGGLGTRKLVPGTSVNSNFA